jgi:FkbH-like protein
MVPELEWLPRHEDWAGALSRLEGNIDPASRWESLISLANYRIDFVQTLKLDRALRRTISKKATTGNPQVVKLALLASSTTEHLCSGIRVAGLRHGIVIEIYEAPYGQYWQELCDPSSGLFAFQPDIVLFSFDARHVVRSQGATVSSILDAIQGCWNAVRKSLAVPIIQQTILPIFRPAIGNNEHQLTESPHWSVQQVNTQLRLLAASERVYLLAVDTYSQTDGIREWHDERLWHRAKQEIHPRVSPFFGDLVARVVALIRGRSSKCLVLDLDNTLWGGVIGDDGIEGILLGQGSAVGEAYLAFQQYVLDLWQRGVILAVCSKNDEENAIRPFEKHPEMLLKRHHIACFVANWRDKAANLRDIAKSLNIGIDSLVFVDDNPVERQLVRTELPMVMVPEMPEDPADYISCLSCARYFETLSITAEDRERGRQYQANVERELMRESSTNMADFLAGLQMRLIWNTFDAVSLSRIVQLINKTNQFNLCTRRYTETEVRTMLENPEFLGLQYRLTDRFGDNGIIGIVIGRIQNDADLLIDTWLMSCRVLGRRVELAMLEVLIENAKNAGIRRLIGEYLPTAKNAMVRDHYPKLGFRSVSEHPDGSSLWEFELETFEPSSTFIRLSCGSAAST